MTVTGKGPQFYFRTEAREIVDALSSELLGLGRGSGAPDAIQKLFRLAHTLKGAAHVVQSRDIADLAHSMEDVLGLHRESGNPLSSREVDELLCVVGIIDGHVRELDAPGPKRAGTGNGSSATSGANDAVDSVRIDLEELDVVTDAVFEARVQTAALRSSTAELGSVSELARRLERAMTEQVSLGASARSASSWVNRARTLAIALRDELSSVERRLETRVETLAREIERVRGQTEHLRMVRVSSIFPSLERAAREAASAADRSIEFSARGGDVRLDRHVLPAVRDAMTQAVRNAVDHGIEPESERCRRGKPALGRIMLRVARRGNRVAFACEDDGGGIDLDAVRTSALSRGLLSEQDAATLDLEGATRLVFAPGLSTSSSVTELSGRGVGLDVVESTARRLNGSVTLSTEPGRGTVIELLVPVSLSSLTALSVRIGTETSLVPIDAITSTLAVKDREIVRSPEGELVRDRERLVPFVPLSRFLGRQPRQRQSDAMWSIVVVAARDRVVALGAESLGGSRQVVVRPVPEAAGTPRFVLGAALDIDGTPQLVLDTKGIVEALPSLLHGPTESAPKPRQRRPILVVDDSLTTRMLEQSILHSAGYEVDLACSAEEGLEKAAAREYGLFIVDVEMPKMNGFDFTKTTRADPLLGRVPVILVTSLSSDAEKRRGREAGAAAYIVKGEFDQGHFLRRVEELSS